MREIDHHADAVHLGQHFAAECADAVVRGILRRFAGMGIRELIVAGVRERHVAGTALVELQHARDVVTDRVPFSIPITATLRPLCARRVTSPDVRASAISFGAICPVSRCTASNFATARR